MKKFYNRGKELQSLAMIAENSKQSAKMSFVIGRRRVGKTRLLKKAFEQTPFLYFFTAKKSESLLCGEFKELINDSGLTVLHGDFSRFRDIFSQLMDLSLSTPFTLIVDEFQEFININPSAFSDIQNIWDSKKDRSQMNLIFCGSVYSLMKKIFEDKKEPLFGRADMKMVLQPFNVDTLKKIYSDNAKAVNAKNFLAFYIITGGVPRYVELFLEAKATTLDNMLDYIFAQNSLFLDEGRSLLIQEFGKEYAVYFSILTLIASSKTARSEIESILERNVGGHLDRLEKDYGIIRKIKPLFAKPNGRIQKYEIVDHFLRFWFRYIYKYESTIKIGSFDKLKKYVENDFPTYAGRLLEEYFREKLALSGQYTEIGSYWEKGNQNEIDIVAIDKFNKKALIAEVKLKKSKISLNKLEYKSKKLKKYLINYDIEYAAFSLDEI